MSDSTLLEFEHPPSTLPAYLRAVRNKGPLREGQTIPRIEAHVASMTADPAKLQGYREICGFADSDKLPVTFPQIMGLPLQLAVLTQQRFPLRLLGLVHVRNLITQERPIDAREPVDLRSYVEGHRSVHNGVEFDLITEAREVGGKLIWKGVATTLSRGKPTGKKPGKGKPQDSGVIEFGRYASWDAPANIGRRYAMNAGDFNPIHLTAASARLFGFPRAIAHGMWTLARCTAELNEEMPKGKLAISTAFKQPVLLPGSVLLKYGPSKQGTDFALLSADAEKMHLVGQITQG
jgi:hypothetical protein